tara:strand:+ start:294 stop:1115 length:822 start_codon:yes stop_codon:yes gene_type:complete
MAKMMVDVQSERKGSNPGGYCKIVDQKGSFDAYFKYCIGSKIKRGTAFVPHNQPIYEAATFELVRQFGLPVPDFFVLLNEDGQVEFRNTVETKKDHSGRHSYFVSRIERDARNPQLEGIATQIVAAERPFLDLLMVEDVVGKRQNYVFQKDGLGSRVLYCDLGCSFVRANNGTLSLPQRVLKNGRASSRSKKKEKSRLRGKRVISVEGKEIGLYDLVDGLGSLEIPCLNPRIKSPLRSFLNQGEIVEIQNYLSHTFAEEIPKLRKQGLLVNGH